MRAVCNHSVVTIRKVQPNLFKLKSISPFSQFAKCKEERTHFFFSVKTMCFIMWDCGIQENKSCLYKINAPHLN